ncbi:MAG: DUF5320 family protein [Bacteroidota bacterium]|nr:DUF5320 family protein [Bacteroidota bacterium]
MPNYNRKGPENEGPRTGRKLGRSNPENKGLSDEEIARKNADQSKQGQGRGRKDGSGQGQGDRRKFNHVSPKKGKRGPNRKHIPNGDDNGNCSHFKIK